MHPYHHAVSSQRTYVGAVADYLALHSWFDASKAALGHFTHRALRHHREGVAESVRIFGEAITVAGGADIPVEGLGLQHLAEDLGILPAAADWLSHLDLPDALTPTALRTAEDLAAASAQRFGATPELLLPLHRWFLETSAWFPDARHLAMRHHSFGIFEAEARFGVLLATGDERAVPTRLVGEWHVRAVLGRVPAATDFLRHLPTRLVGEWHVRAVLGRVPAATDFLRHLKGQRWMAAAQSSRRLGLG